MPFVELWQGRSRRSGWSGIGRTTISQQNSILQKESYKQSTRVIFALVLL